MGGYDVRDRRLVVNEVEAALVRRIFERLLKLGSGTLLVKELAADGIVGKRGMAFDQGAIYKLLNQRLYIGRVVHKGKEYPGEHAAIIDQVLWDKVHSILADNSRRRANRTRAETPALLKGLIFGPKGRAMTPSHTRKNGRLYRYYVSMCAIRVDADACPVSRVPAGQIEEAVVEQLRSILCTPEVIVRTWLQAKAQGARIPEREVTAALRRPDPLWEELFPAEQARVVQLLVERVEVHPDGLRIRLRAEGLESLVEQLGGIGADPRGAARCTTPSSAPTSG